MREGVQVISCDEVAQARAIRGRVAHARVRSLKVCRSTHSSRGHELLLRSHFGNNFMAVRLGILSYLGILFSCMTHVSEFLGL